MFKRSFLPNVLATQISIASVIPLIFAAIYFLTKKAFILSKIALIVSSVVSETYKNILWFRWRKKKRKQKRFRGYRFEEVKNYRWHHVHFLTGGLRLVVSTSQRQAVRPGVQQSSAIRRSASSSSSDQRSSSDRRGPQRFRRRHQRRQILRGLTRVSTNCIVQTVGIFQRCQLLSARRSSRVQRLCGQN